MTTCKRCGVDGFVWKQLNGKWMLYGSKAGRPTRPHACTMTGAGGRYARSYVHNRDR